MYDVIVMGSDMSSLIAALSLLKRHKKVAFLRRKQGALSAESQGYHFHIDALPWTGLSPGGLLALLLREYDIPFSHADRTGALQVIFRDRRFDFSCREDSPVPKRTAFRGVDRAMERSGNALNDIMAKIAHHDGNNHGEGIGRSAALRVEWWLNSLRSTVDASIAGASPELAGIVPVIYRLLSSLSHDTSIHAPMLLHFLHAATQGFVSPDRKRQLTEKLKERFLSMGGEFFDTEQMSDLYIGKDITVGLEGENPTSRIDAHNLLLSVKWSGFASLMRDDGRFSRLRRRLDTISVREYPFTIHLGVDARAFPEKMSNHVVLCDDTYRSYIDRGIYYLEKSADDDDGSAPAGTRSLTITSFLRNSPRSLNRTYLEKFCMDGIRKIEWFLPFLREQTSFSDAGFSIDTSRVSQEIVNLKYCVRKGMFSGIDSLSMHRTPLSNVFMTGGMLLPGLGFDGEILSGLKAARCLNGE